MAYELLIEWLQKAAPIRATNSAGVPFGSEFLVGFHAPMDIEAMRTRLSTDLNTRVDFMEDTTIKYAADSSPGKDDGEKRRTGNFYFLGKFVWVGVVFQVSSDPHKSTEPRSYDPAHFEIGVGAPGKFVPVAPDTNNSWTGLGFVPAVIHDPSSDQSAPPSSGNSLFNAPFVGDAGSFTGQDRALLYRIAAALGVH